MAEGDALDAPRARQLLRRTGFGATPADVAGLMAKAATVGEAADRIVGFKPSGFQPGGRDEYLLHDNWVAYMIKAKAPLNEKLTLFFHDHFATSYSKVLDVKFMGAQNRLFRKIGTGSFMDLVKAVNRDAAMIEYLDTVRNRKNEPNENYARELQELFTLGTVSVHGDANYAQEDIVQIARAFSGWGHDSSNPTFDAGEHDTTAEFPERGPKVIFRTVGGFGPGGRSFANPEGPTEIDQVVDILFAHRDRDGASTVARRTARRLFEFLAHGGFATTAPGSPELQAVDEVVARSAFTTTWSIRDLVREILVHDRFYDSLSNRALRSVKWPVDYVVSTLRMLGVKPKGKYRYIAGGAYGGLREHLNEMGQLVFDPPSVFGWDWEGGWVSSATMLARYRFARDVSARYAEKYDPLKFLALPSGDPDVVVDRVTTYLGVRDDLTSADLATLRDFLGGPVALGDREQVRTKIHGLIVLVLQSPAYHLH